MRPGMSPPPSGLLCGPGPRMPGPQQSNMGFGNNSDFRPPSAGGTGTEMLRKQLEQNQPPNSMGNNMQPIKSPMGSQLLGGGGHPSMGQSSLSSSNSLLMAQLEKQPPCNPDPKVINQVANTLANKIPSDNLHNLLPNQPHMGGQQNSMESIGKMEIKMEDDIKREIKEEPMDSSFPDTSQNDLQPIKKEEIKSEDDIKKEAGPASSSSEGASSSSATGTALVPVSKAEPGEPSAASKLPLGANKVTFSPEELKKALEPPLMKLYNQEPEAIPFRVPVDPNALGIPDYFEIIKKPMDMASIKRKLDTGGYNDPWEYIEDIWQMFENAWTYNRKTSRVYKYCSKVSWLYLCCSSLFAVT